MLEKIEIGKKYLNSCGKEVEVLFVGRKYTALNDNNGEELYQSTRYALDSWSELPPPKKRYWLWDAKDDSGRIFKTSTYVEDNGCASSGELYFDKEMLIRKHENEWIEV